MRKLLIDTNAYSQFMSGNEKVLEIISESDVIYLSIFVIAELRFGFKLGNKKDENIKYLKKFYSKPIVQILNATSETADIYSDIKIQLKNKGKPIPNNDIWIAAHAIETGSVIITKDLHFDFIDGIRKLNY